MVVRFDKRHNYFMRFSPAQRTEVYNILNGNHTPRDMVDLVCKELKTGYVVNNVPNHPGNLKMFVLTGNYDCVIVGKEHIIWEKIVDYFNIMFNFKLIF